MDNFQFASPPPYRGYFAFGGLVCNCINKPNRFQRLMYKICFGWKWYDYDA